MASGAPPRERKDAVWAGFEVAGGLWVLRSRSARFSSVKHARTHTHTHAHTRTYTHTHTHTYRCAGGSYPSHPTSSVHLDIDLLCAPNGIAESGIFRKGSARPERCAHATLGTGQSLPAYSRRLVSLQAVDRFVLAHGTCLRSAGCSASDLEPRCLVACACTICTSCDPIEVHSPEWRPLAACSRCSGCILHLR